MIDEDNEIHYHEILTTSKEQGADSPDKETDIDPDYTLVKDIHIKIDTLGEVANSTYNEINPDIALRVARSYTKPVTDSEVMNSSYNEIPTDQNREITKNSEINNNPYNEIPMDRKSGIANNPEEANSLYSDIAINPDDDTVNNPYNQLVESGNNDLDMEHVSSTNLEIYNSKYDSHLVPLFVSDIFL